MKYNEWLNIWLDNYVKPSSKERTFIRYEQIIRTHIAPKIGETDVNDLTPIVLQSFVTELLKSGNLRTGKELSPNFVNTIIVLFTSGEDNFYLIFEKIFDGYIRKNKVYVSMRFMHFF